MPYTKLLYHTGAEKSSIRPAGIKKCEKFVNNADYAFNSVVENREAISKKTGTAFSAVPVCKQDYF